MSEEIKVKVIQRSLKESDLVLSRWPKPGKAKKGTLLYALGSGWMKVVKESGIKEKDVVRV